MPGQNALHLASDDGSAAPYVIDFEIYQRYGRALNPCMQSLDRPINPINGG